MTNRILSLNPDGSFALNKKYRHKAHESAEVYMSRIYDTGKDLTDAMDAISLVAGAILSYRGKKITVDAFTETIAEMNTAGMFANQPDFSPGAVNFNLKAMQGE